MILDTCSLQSSELAGGASIVRVHQGVGMGEPSGVSSLEALRDPGTRIAFVAWHGESGILDGTTDMDACAVDEMGSSGCARHRLRTLYDRTLDF